MPECPSCGGRTEAAFRYCPWCAAPQRLKLVEFFRPHPLLEAETEKALRVSRYLGVDDSERQVRFSIWKDVGRDSAEAKAAVSLDDSEADRLARFLQTGSSAETSLLDEAETS